MIIFNTFFNISKKHIGNLIMYTIIFLGIVIISTNMASNDVESFEETKLNVAIFNHNDSNISNSLAQYVSEKNNIVTFDENLDTIRDKMYYRDVDYVIILPENFNTTLSIEAYKLPGSISAQLLDMSINDFISTFNAYEKLGLSEKDIYEKTLSTLNESSDVSIYNADKETTTSNEHRYYMYMPYVLLCVIALGVSPTLMIFNKNEISKRTLCSGISVLKRNFYIGLGCLIYTLGVAAFYIILSIILYGNSIFSECGYFRIINTLSYALISISFALLVSNITLKANVLDMFTNVFALGSAFICGIFVPREFLSDSVIAIGRFVSVKILAPFIYFLTVIKYPSKANYFSFTGI